MARLTGAAAATAEATVAAAAGQGPTPRPEVAALAPVAHGSAGDAELARYGLAAAQAADFSANCNPLGPSPRVRETLVAVNPARYPDEGAAALRGALARRFGVAPAQIAVGNGSAELIWLIALAYLRPGDGFALFEPTFGEYARAARLMGAHVAAYRTRAADGFRLDVPDAVAWLRAQRPAVAVLCNPNNPTGTYLDGDGVAALADAVPQTLLVVDEAYAAFLRPAAGARAAAEPLRALLPLIDTGRVVLLRSMTKDYALAGLRLGYAIGPAPVVDALIRARPPWSVNAAAQAAGLAALADEAHLAAGQRCAAAAIDFMQVALRQAGYHAYTTRANFFLVEVDDAAAVRRALLPHGLVVRDCASFGLPNMIRIAARPLPDCERLVAALRALREAGG